MDYFLGMILPLAFDWAPRQTAFANGQLLPIQQNNALFALLGNRYGGDGTKTFALPNLNGRTAIGAGNPARSGINVGQAAGEETHILTINEMPDHTHALFANQDTAQQSLPNDAVFAEAPVPTYGDTGQMVALGGSPPGTSGSSHAHQNMQPFLTINCVVTLSGIFPSRG
ncbi:phage tail protein [Stakelama pacifica]|uniref:Microcystin-dependent protein n=1 Tax=Stakelama pacifica TaxID=517720 RepID=A0A4R6FCZ2_9SPHN|nr:tail fiber protein [Stakelama pacifica]TDN78993.1 microcystin-dependent protein [Stakelama pacifica]GGO98924.1 microcystin dependent protein [Stakelama pacifica]